MYFTTWKVGDEEYKLRLNTMQTIQVEKQLGMGMAEIASHLADTTTIVTILFGAMQPLNHGVNFKDVCNIYDEYLEDGGTLEDMMDIMMELLAQAGYGERSERKNGTSPKMQTRNLKGELTED
jgi:hypothetical protein